MLDFALELICAGLVTACFVPRIVGTFRRAGLGWLIGIPRVFGLLFLPNLALVVLFERMKPWDEQNWDGPIGVSGTAMLVCSILALIALVAGMFWVRRRPKRDPISPAGDWFAAAVILPCVFYTLAEQMIYFYPVAKEEFLMKYAPNSAAARQMVADSTSPPGTFSLEPSGNASGKRRVDSSRQTKHQPASRAKS